MLEKNKGARGFWSELIGRKVVSKFLSRRVSFLSVLLGLCIFTPRLSAESVSLAWNASPGPNIVGYRVYYGYVSGSDASVINVGNQISATISGLQAGSNYFFVATAVDNSGLESVPSNEVSYRVPTANPAPTIVLTSPSNGAGYTAPATVNLAASVTANGNTITKVQFYNGSTLLGEDASAPYAFSWSNVSSGNYTLSARAVYGSGSTVTSSSASISVTNPPPPTIALTSPANGASYTAPATIDCAASVAANGNAITSVQFFNGTTLVGTDTSAPYSFTLSNVSAGSYSLTARAVYGGSSTVASSSANVTVTNSAPASGLTFEATSGTITAPFVASGGMISQPMQTAIAGSGRAVYNFTVVNAGNYLVSANVDAPSEGENSLFVNIDGEPTDPFMVWQIPVTSGLQSRVVGWQGNGTWDNSEFAPKIFTLTAGTHQLIVRGREANTKLGTITLSPVTNSTPPTIALTSPANGASYTAPATIDCAASVAANGNAITSVQFFNGATLVGTDTSAPYSFTLSNVSVGSYSLTARAVYGESSTVASSSANVTVTNSAPASGLTFEATSGTITAPFVASGGMISQPMQTALAGSGRAVYNFAVVNAGDYLVSANVDAPSEGENSFFVNIDGEPTDPFMVWQIPVTSGLQSRVVGWQGNGTWDNSEFAPKIFTLTTGTHQLIVRGREANTKLGTITLSPVTNSTPPTVVLTSPTANASYTAPTTVNMAASVTANGHTVSKVQFYNGATLLGEDTSAPYSFNWSNVSAGNYSVTAAVVYDAGSSLASTSVNVVVVNPSPTIALTSPVNGATYSSPATITCSASVVANGNAITSVQFFNGTTLLGTDTTAPYSLTLSNVSAGSYALSAAAIYDAGSVVDSASASITVSAPSTALPAPWQTTNIGTGLPGSATHSNGVFSVTGSGAVTGTADSFRFAYQTLSADGEIRARLSSIGNNAGVMIRESLTAGSTYAYMGSLQNGRFRWQSRSKTSGSTTAKATGTIGATPNIWVRLVRSGNTFTYYQSTDGTNWKLVSTRTIAMAANIYVGLVGYSGSSTTQSTSSFTSVSVVP